MAKGAPSISPGRSAFCLLIEVQTYKIGTFDDTRWNEIVGQKYWREYVVILRETRIVDQVPLWIPGDYKC